MVEQSTPNQLNLDLKEPLAIIGVSCHFPGMNADVEDLSALYDLLMKGQTAIQDIPKTRWNVDEYYSPIRNKPDAMITRKGGFLKNIQGFDADFFKLAAIEIKQMDPQHRLFLEGSIRALNHANLTLDSLHGSCTGVYCGMSSHDYNQLNLKDKIEFNAYTQIGVASSAAAGRLSHFLNLKGPSLVVDTACSSSLSALYLAAMALRMRQCALAIVGGVHLNICPENFIGLSKANMLSGEGVCRSFDAQADGFARSEGCGVLIVKRLSDALLAKDTIHAVVKSIVMNQDGDSPSLVAPNLNAQIALHQAALDEAQLKAKDIAYIEAHGTGTVLGDAVEFQAIQTLHQAQHSIEKPLVIGALKSNLGHAIASSGVASIIKTIAALKYECIPPNINYSSPNSSIDPQSIPSIFPLKPLAFTKNDQATRRVQISNFGFSGTNVAAILEEAPSSEPASVATEPSSHCFVLSAQSESSLKQMIANYACFLQSFTASLSDLCATLIQCRDHYAYRCAILAENVEALLKAITRKEYVLKKVSIGLDIQIQNQDAKQIQELFLSGAKIKLDRTEFNKIDLPLYPFDRQIYWHEPRTAVPEPLTHEPIAIIGMSCRFPKAANLDAFLALLQKGESGIDDIPIERWNNEDYYSADVNALGKLYNKQMGLLNGIKEFDAEFFNISPREAKLMSPQLRILMETSYHALEEANLSLDSIKGSNTGVFVGCERNDYPYVLFNQGFQIEDLGIYFSTGNALSALPGRIAYSFHLNGPTQLIDTACSSSITAIHNACLSLQAQECTMALAGGINILLNPVTNISLSRAHMLSPESRCKTFSVDADGYARSEGCGMLVLKRLSTALQDKDKIFALIKGSAINSDGKSEGFTVPNGRAQELVIRRALAKAKLTPRDIDYIEAHGTGTPLADPIEVKTLVDVFSESHSQENPLYISTVKTNIGHCESASGVAGIIKVILSIQTQTFFKHLNFKQLNPAIQLKNLSIPLTQMPWHKKDALRCVGVNSFGFSGANAHVILQEAPSHKKQVRRGSEESLLLLSAKNKESLQRLLTRYQNHLATTQDAFEDICFTAATCRTHFLFRVAIKASTAAEAAALIDNGHYRIYEIKKEKHLVQQPVELQALKAAYEEGFTIRWWDFYKNISGSFEKVRLPLYEFTRKEYWFENKNRVPLSPFTLQPIQVKTKNMSTWLKNYQLLAEDQRFKACQDFLLQITQKIQELSKTDHLDVEAGFFDIGFDSLMLTEMAFMLQEELQPTLRVSVHIAFDYPSIHQLATYLHHELNTLLNFPLSAPSKSESRDEDAIAIIGMSCSFPKAADISAFERMLEQGLSGIQDIPLTRWDNSQYYDPNPNAPGKSYVKQLGLMDSIQEFDANFFGISPREASFMDPQQRIFLECCYQAMENANYPVHQLRGGLTGVFAGVSANEFYTQLEKSGFQTEEMNLYSITGNALNLVSGRVAYVFDFKGPSLSVDTACSSSLVAIHYACQSLKTKEIDYALAGGVNVLLLPESNVTLCKARALSPEGLCKTFDATADGFARSEGCGVLLLKRLSDAIRDEDRILAVIKASAVNNDGKSAGLTVPNGKSQEEVMLKALNQTQLNRGDITYVEAHGTGTPLGDPIEVHAINQVYGKQRTKDNPLYIGSVKTNIGHLESASGVASLIKTILALQHNKIYKHLNFKTLNPHISIQDTQIALQTMDWMHNEKPKYAGINAFGFSGTNAHVILQDSPANLDIKKSHHFLKEEVLVLSAKSKISLDQMALNYQHYLATTEDSFADICFTAAICREHYVHRLIVIAKDAASASLRLERGQFQLSDGKTPVLDLPPNSALHDLCRAYLSGEQVDWLVYYQELGEKFTKVSLPLYPFHRQVLWPDKTREKIEIQPQRKVLEQFYASGWLPLEPVQVRASSYPPLFVISKDPIKARKRLGALQYQLISSLNELDFIEDKNILFHYEQDQFMELFHCCQSLYKSFPQRFILVTEQAYALTSQEEVNPYHTMASSFWKSFSNELDCFNNYSVDVDSQGSLEGALTCILNRPHAENQYAVRDAIYVPRLEKIELDSQPEIQMDSLGTYLIVGGTGGLAKPLLDYLMKRQAKRIVLVSRSQCSLQMQNLIEEAAKEQVIIIHHAANASDFKFMQAIIEQIENSPHRLKGVFHLAAVIEDGLVVHLNDEKMQAVLNAKMESALILHQLTKNSALDHFVLFSSTASLLGGRGQSNYAAANGFLDGLAHLRHHQGRSGLAINWGPFHSPGMAASRAPALQERGFIPLDEGCMNFLDRVLDGTLAQISPCPMNWDLYFKNAPKQSWLSTVYPGASSMDQRFLNSLRFLSTEECVLQLSEALCEITTQVLSLDGLQPITPAHPLFSLGMDSLMSLEIRHRIHDKLQCQALSIPIEYFIHDPNIEKIARHITAELQVYFHKSELSSPSLVLTEQRLCDFQYHFWVLNAMEYDSNVGMQLQLQGTLNKDFVLQAFEGLVKTQEALWLHFSKNSLVQRVNKEGQFHVIYKDLSLIEEEDALESEFYTNIRRRIPLTKGPLIRVYLYKINQVLHELHLIVPHIIADIASCDILLSQFKANYEALMRSKIMPKNTQSTSFLKYVQLNNQHYEINLKEKINFWKEYNKGYKKLEFKGHQYPDSSVERIKHLFHYTLAPQYMEQFMDWHKKHNLNLSTGLIAVCQQVFYRLSQQTKIPIQLIHSGREGSDYKNTVGLFSEYKRINLHWNAKSSFKACVLAIEEQLLKTAPYQKCSLLIKNLGLDPSRFSLGHFFSGIYSKWSLGKALKQSKFNKWVAKVYLQFFSQMTLDDKTFFIKFKLNQLFKTNLPLLPPQGLNVLISITPSFFVKEIPVQEFANLEYTYTSHFGCLDRPVGNQVLWIYFAKNQQGEYILSINGPVTTACKDQFAYEFNQVISSHLRFEGKDFYLPSNARDQAHSPERCEVIP